MFKVLSSSIFSYWTDENVRQKRFSELRITQVLTWRNSDLILSIHYAIDSTLLFEFGKDWLFNLFSTEPTASSLFPTLPFQKGPLPCILGSKLLGFVQCFGQSAVCHRYGSKLSYLHYEYWKNYSHWEMEKLALCFEKEVELFVLQPFISAFRMNGGAVLGTDASVQ